MGPHMFDDAILGCKAVFIGAIIPASSQDLVLVNVLGA